MYLRLYTLKILFWIQIKFYYKCININKYPISENLKMWMNFIYLVVIESQHVNFIEISDFCLNFKYFNYNLNVSACMHTHICVGAQVSSRNMYYLLYSLRYRLLWAVSCQSPLCQNHHLLPSPPEPICPMTKDSWWVPRRPGWLG